MASRGRVLRATIAEPICSAKPSTSLALCVAVRWRSRRLRMSKSSEGAGDLTSKDKSKSAIAAGSVEFASNDSVEAAATNRSAEPEVIPVDPDGTEELQIGRESCRARVCQYGEVRGVTE